MEKNSDGNSNEHSNFNELWLIVTFECTPVHESDAHLFLVYNDILRMRIHSQRRDRMRDHRHHQVAVNRAGRLQAGVVMQRRLLR